MNALPLVLQAATWGAVAGGALLFGALIGYFIRLPIKVSGSIMAFGVGVLISALAFELMHEAFLSGGIVATTVGFIAGVAVYAFANAALATAGARARKRSNRQAGTAASASLAIAVGSLLDGVPESAAIGVS